MHRVIELAAKRVNDCSDEDIAMRPLLGTDKDFRFC